ncbi:MAG TPA: hypothetical protein VMH28_24480 [Candidatus Acidoferrales bacterium]|nr:hypothetical protein [Candidatus Acidoferrales bacterium]
MPGLIWVLEAVLLGCLLVYRWTDLRAVNPRPARMLLIFGAGTAGGIGLTSCIFFLAGPLMKLAPADPLVELALLAWVGYLCFRMPPHSPASSPRLRSRLAVPLAAALVVTLVIAAAAILSGLEANPHGYWDAWAIWNLRARFLISGGGLAARAWSPVLGATTHAAYPMLLSSFVARCWLFGNVTSAVVPAAASLAFFLALVALVTGGIAVLRGGTLGLLAGLSIAATPSLLHQIPALYADVPLACYMAGAVIFLLLEQPLPAGIFAALSAWTKDEGILFLLVFLAASAVWRRSAIRAVVAGALPVAVLLIGFKRFLAGGSSSLFFNSLPGAAHRILDPARYGTVLSAFEHEFISMGIGWYHPLLPWAVLAVALGLDPKQRRTMFFVGAIILVLLAGDFGVYIVADNDLAWLVQTSLNRILVQVWPLLAIAAFLALRSPDVFGPAPQLPAKSGRKARRATSR